MKLQTVQHADGSLEIQRKLSLDWLAAADDRTIGVRSAADNSRFV